MSKNRTLKLLKNKYINFFLVLLLLLLLGVPTFSKLKNRVTINNVEEWDGSVATSYKKGNGSQSNPYEISNASEFAYFIEQSKNNTYSNTYFKLSNDIIINQGTLSYDETNKAMYTINDTTYYLGEYSNNYYSNNTRNDSSIGSIKLVDSIENFEGVFDGDSHTIFGLYIANNSSSKLGLFTDLKGTLKNLYVENSLIYGGNTTGGIASNANGATISNVLFDGNVVSKNTESTEEVNINSFSISATPIENMQQTSVVLPNIDGNITKTVLTGEYRIDNNTSNNIIKIDNNVVNESSFTIDLGTTLKNQIDFSVISDSNATITFDNLKYTIYYSVSTTAGIVGKSTNTTLTNIINNSNVYGGYTTSGIVGNTNSILNINRVYNTGNIKGNEIAAGIISNIENSNSITIDSTYNTGEITATISGAIIGNANDSTVNISNSFNTSANYSIGTNRNGTITITNSYNTNNLTINSGITSGSFINTNINNLKSSEFIKNTLGYNEFVSLDDVETNINNTWIIEDGNLPTLFVDNVSNSLVTLNLSKYNWNNYTTSLNVLNIGSNVSFVINKDGNDLKIKKIYYYLSNSQTPLSKTELENVTWNEYSGKVTISTSGYYVIYVKTIDTSDNVHYINSDIIALNLNTSKNISLDSNIWDSLFTNLKNVYIDRPKNIIINANDDLIGIKSISYHISNEELTENQVKEISNWTNYNNYIEINTIGNYIIYAKIVDNNDKVTYLNTDIINYNGYTEELTLGKNNIDYNSNYITSNSSIKLKFTTNFDYKFKAGYKHVLRTNILLPQNTSLTLIDYKTNKVYNYKINTSQDNFGYNDSCKDTGCSKFASYDFSLFKEVGTINNIYYDDATNDNKTISNENFIIIIDFKDAVINENINDLNFKLVVVKNSDAMLETLNDTMSNISIYSSNISSVDIANNYNNTVVTYNSDTASNIQLTNSITYGVDNSKNIINTTYEEKSLGLLFKFVDSSNNDVDKKYLNNMYVTLDNKNYYFDSSNTIKVPYGKINNITTKSLTLSTIQNSNKLTPGLYYLKVSNFITTDNITYDTKNTTEISIPILVTYNGSNINYTFNVTNENINLEKNSTNKTITFNITETGNLRNPIIKLSLYEKKNLTAYNQEYKLVDLSSYTTNTLNSLPNNKYNIGNSSMNFDLTLKNNVFNNNSYKYLFELYDGDTKISEQEKYFIVN